MITSLFCRFFYSAIELIMSETFSLKIYFLKLCHLYPFYAKLIYRELNFNIENFTLKYITEKEDFDFFISLIIS